MSPKTKGIIISLVAIGFSWLCAWLGDGKNSDSLLGIFYFIMLLFLSIGGIGYLFYSIIELKD